MPTVLRVLVLAFYAGGALLTAIAGRIDPVLPHHLTDAHTTVLAPPPRSSSSRELRVLTYNIWGTPPLFSADQTRHHDIPLQLADYDIVGLQEAWTVEVRGWVDIADLEHRVWGRLGGFPVDKFGNGLVLLSRFPILETAEMQFSHCKGMDCTARKGALFARLEMGAGEVLDVYVTHLQADTVFAAQRQRQIEELADFMSLHEGGNPTLVLGDLNLDAELPAYGRMLQTLSVRDAWSEVAQSDPGHTYSTRNDWVGGWNDDARLDYVLMRSGLHHEVRVQDARVRFAERVGGRHLSDHFGVDALFRIDTGL